MKGEFHIHTTYSDGEYSVKYILEYLKGNVDYFCITDHDCIDGSIEAFEQANDYGLKSLIGVEISTYLKNESVHVLGYFNNPNDAKAIHKFLDEIRKARIERLYKIKELLLKYFDFDLDISTMIEKTSITRGTIATQILKQTDKYTREEIFATMIGDTCPAYVPVAKLATVDAINKIHECHGVAIIAHPAKLKKIDYKVFLEMGVDGYEAIYPSNKEEQTRAFIAFCNENDLVYTAGNDFHYFNCYSHGDLLQLSIEGEPLDKFLNKVLGKNEY